MFQTWCLLISNRLPEVIFFNYPHHNLLVPILSVSGKHAHSFTQTISIYYILQEYIISCCNLFTNQKDLWHNCQKRVNNGLTVSTLADSVSKAKRKHMKRYLVCDNTVCASSCYQDYVTF